MDDNDQEIQGRGRVQIIHKDPNTKVHNLRYWVSIGDLINSRQLMMIKIVQPHPQSNNKMWLEDISGEI